MRLRFTLAGCRLTDIERWLLASDFDRVFADRKREADEFYATVIPPRPLRRCAETSCARRFGGLLWSKQFYHYVVKDWLEGDPGQAATARRNGTSGRNHEWASPLQRRRHLHARQVGVSVVCGLGPGLSLRSAGAGRFANSPRSSSC